jgi:CO dehydrogenase nickel-insertion accessory protein CooC1
MIVCWSVKGGSGTTVVASTLALVHAAQSSRGALIVDLAGDVPAVLGLAEPTGIGELFDTVLSGIFDRTDSVG